MKPPYDSQALHHLGRRRHLLVKFDVDLDILPYVLLLDVVDRFERGSNKYFTSVKRFATKGAGLADAAGMVRSFNRDKIWTRGLLTETACGIVGLMTSSMHVVPAWGNGTGQNNGDDRKSPKR